MNIDIPYHNNVIVKGEGLLFEEFGNVTQKVDFKVFEDLDILEDSAIKKCSHLYFQILIKDSEYFFLVYFHSFLTVKDVLEVPSNLQSQLFGNFLSYQELIHIGHLLFVLSCMHIVSINQTSN